MPSEQKLPPMFSYTSNHLMFSYRTSHEDGNRLIFQIVNSEDSSVFTLYNFAEIHEKNVGMLIQFISPYKALPSIVSYDPLHCLLHDTLVVVTQNNKHEAHYHSHLDKPVDLAFFKQIVANLIKGTEEISYLRENDLIKRYLSSEVQAALAESYQEFLSNGVVFSFTNPMKEYPVSWYLPGCPGQRSLPANNSARHPVGSHMALGIVLGIVLFSILSHFIYKMRKQNNPPSPAPVRHPHPD